MLWVTAVVSGVSKALPILPTVVLISAVIIQTNICLELYPLWEERMIKVNVKLIKDAKKMLKELNGKKNALESMKRLIACGEGGLIDRYKRAKVDVEVTEAAFSGLDYKERDILSAFYVDSEPHAAERLSEKYDCAVSTVYRMKRSAMNKFVLRMFGDGE